MNPYSGSSFFEFFGILFERIVHFLLGKEMHWVSDEVQLAVLLLSALGCGLIAPFLILKRLAMFANALSHTSLLGVIGAFLLSSLFFSANVANPWILFLGAVLSAIVTAGLIHAATRLFKLQEDAAIGLVFTSLFAFGVIFASLFTRNCHLSAEAVMGNADALQVADISLAFWIALINAAFVLLFFRPLLAISFDEPFAKVMGLSVSSYRALFFLLTAVTSIGAFRAVGVVVILALLVGPYLIARKYSHCIGRLLWLTPAIGMSCCIIGVALSRAILSISGIALSTSGVLTAVISAAFLLSSLKKEVSGKQTILS